MNIYKKWKSTRLNALVILNKRGDIIWAHILNKGKVNKSMRYLLVKKYGNKIYTFYRNVSDGKGKEKALLEIVDIFNPKNKIIKDVTKIKPHHDFIIKDNSMYFLKKENKVIRNIILDQKKWQGDSLFEWNFKTGKLYKHWDSFDVIFPEVEKVLKNKNKGLLKNDFTHGNSIFLDENGDWLVSFRNLNTILILDNKFKLKRKIVSKSDKDFYWQHHVQKIQLNNKSYFLMFNNQKE